jgi:hypothetical protein
MAEGAYKVKQDISIPRPVRESELPDGTKVEETEGRTYGVGDYVLEEDISSAVKDRIESGDLDDFLESVGREEAEEAMKGVGYGTFIAQHSAEAFVLDQYGHTVVPREQVVELASAGAEEVSQRIEEAKEDDADERNVPGLPEEEVDEEQAPAELPPGVSVGAAKAEAQGGSKRSGKRARPQSHAKTPVGAQQAGTDPTSAHQPTRARQRSERSESPKE